METWLKSRLMVLSAALVAAASVFPHTWAGEPVVPPVPGASVARSMFTTDITEREPVDDVITLDNTVDKIFFFTELRNLQGRTVTHRWEYQERMMSEVSFEVGGPRWRVYSSKKLDPTLLGKWTVVVLDESGWPLHACIFMYQDASEGSPRE